MAKKLASFPAFTLASFNDLCLFGIAGNIMGDGKSSMNYL